MSMSLSPMIDGAPEAHTFGAWIGLAEIFAEWGIDVSCFTDCNFEYVLIPEETCVHIANAIEAQLSEFPEDKRQQMAHYAARWRRSGGFFQV